MLCICILSTMIFSIIVLAISLGFFKVTPPLLLLVQRYRRRPDRIVGDLDKGRGKGAREFQIFRRLPGRGNRQLQRDGPHTHGGPVPRVLSPSGSFLAVAPIRGQRCLYLLYTDGLTLPAALFPPAACT
jgi:hypothetical protein